MKANFEQIRAGCRVISLQRQCSRSSVYGSSGRSRNERYENTGEVSVGCIEWKGNERSGMGSKENAPLVVLDVWFQAFGKTLIRAVVSKLSGFNVFR